MLTALLPAARRAALLRCGLLLALLLPGLRAAAQTTLTGRVLDQQTQQPLPAANVLLKTDDAAGKLVLAVLTDAAGRFVLPAVPPGRYQLQVLMLSFAPHAQALTVAPGAAPLDLGTITLAPATQTLGEVVVTAPRPLLEQRPDRVVMNVAGSLLAAGNNAADILAAAPSVQLIDGRLTFRGKDNVLILLDGKRLPSGTTLETLLASIPGDQIARIELISNPSAKYDADASGGVIEIYTKRPQTLGWTANVGANARQGYRTGAGLNGGLRVSTPKLDLTASGSLTRRGGFEHATASRTFFEGRAPAAYLAQRSRLNKVIRDGSISASLNYHPAARTTLGAAADVLRSSLDAPAGTAQTVLTRPAGVTTSDIQEAVLLRDGFSNYALFGKHELDSLGSYLLLTGNYATYTNDQRQTFDQRVMGPADSLGLAGRSFRNYIPATYHIATVRADYTKVWRPATQLEAGLKYTDTRNRSRQQAETLAEDGTTWMPAPLTPFARLGYQERVAAAYFTLNHTTGPLTLQAGLRAERTHYQVVSGIDSSYVNLFPNLRADYKVTADYTASLAYAKTIRRPAYESLIPYERFQDPYTTTRGNARLRPEYQHRFSWNNLYKGYGLQLEYTRAVGAISEVYLYNEAQLRFIATQQNLPRRHLATATLTAPVTVARWWTMSNSAGLLYQQLSFPDPLDNATALTKRKTTFNVSSDNTFSWGRGWSARVYGLYNSPSFNGLFDWAAYSYVSVGVKKSFWDKRATLSLSVVDPFYQLNFRVSSQVVPVVSSELLRNDTRQARLAFTYSFGKGQLKGKRVETSGNAEERGRLGQ